MSISAAFALASLIGSPTTPATSPAARPEELIRLLGDKSYRVREVAARALISRGSAEQDQGRGKELSFFNTCFRHYCDCRS